MKSSLSFAFFCATAVFATQFHDHSVVIPLIGANQLLIPVAGSTPGANGTFFRSDISIINLGNHDATVTLEWIPQSGRGTITTITLPKQRGIRSTDFVAEYLHQTGLGAIMITATTSEGVDVDAALYVSSRIWTVQPGTSGGTTSQSLPAVTPSAFFTGETATLFSAGGGLENPANYRVNVGIVNADPITTHTFDIAAPSNTRPFGANHFSVTLPPRSMAQVSLGSDLIPNGAVVVHDMTATTSRTTAWIAYASTIDNITSDAWSELAVPVELQ